MSLATLRPAPAMAGAILASCLLPCAVGRAAGTEEIFPRFTTSWAFPLTSVEGDQFNGPSTFQLVNPTWLKFCATTPGPSGQSGTWQSTANGIERVVRRYDPLPGLPSGFQYMSGYLNSSIAGNGDVWFTGTVNNEGQVWRKTASGPSLVLAPGQTAPLLAATISGANWSRLASDGTAYLYANVATTPPSTVLYRYHDATFQIVHQTGQVVPGSTRAVNSINTMRLLENGSGIFQIGFNASPSISGVAVLQPGETLASVGVIPSLTGYQLRFASSAGAMILTKASGTFGQSIWRRTSDGQLGQVVEPGGAVPGMAGWTVLPNNLGPTPTAVGISNDGRALFNAIMGPSSSRRQTLALGTPTSVLPLLQTGQAFGGGTVNFSDTVVATEFNALGQVAFEVGLTRSSASGTAVMAYDPTLGLFEVVGPGSQRVIDGMLRTITSATLCDPMSDQSPYSRGGLFDSGSLSIAVQYAEGGSPSIIRTVIPAPGGVTLGALAASLVVRRRRRLNVHQVFS